MILEKRKRFKYLARYSFIALLFAVLALGSVVCFSAEQANEFFRSITSDEEAQAEINQMASSFKSWSHELFSEEEWETFSQEVREEEFWLRVIDKLKSSTGKETDELLLQVLLAYGGKLERRENPESGMTKKMLIPYLAQEIPEQELLSLIAPHLEKTTEPLLKKNLKQVLALVAYKSFKDNADIDFVEFDSYLKKRKNNPPYSLIEFMYQIKPKAAAVAMTRVYKDEEAADALKHKLRTEEDDKVIEDLSISDEWWENLYVAVTMQENRGYQDPVIIEMLKKNKHPLVRKALTELKDR